MKPRHLLLALLPAAAWAAAPRHFDVQASFLPSAKPGGEAAVAVLFTPLDADVRVNETPAPRLKLAAGQAVLVDRQTPPAPSSGDAPSAAYLDPELPVRFPVALAPGAAKGRQLVKASVVYFYCSKTAGWCRKGTSDVEIAVLVP